MHVSNSSISTSEIGRSVRVDGIRVAGIFACVPKRVVHNSHFESLFGVQQVAEVVRMIGVRERRWVASDMSGGDLTFLAASELLKRLSWSADSVDVIVYVSQTPDYVMPATACVLQNRLGLSPCCAAFDINLGCSAYPYALWTVMSLMRASGFHRALVCVSDTMSKVLDSSDRATALLFGDAATVTALESDESEQSAHFIFGTEGSGYSDLIVAQGARGLGEPVISAKQLVHPDKLHMDGWSVFNFTIKVVPKLVNESLTHAALVDEQIDYFLFHQANGFMLDHLAKKSKLDARKILKNLEYYGNTSCASIPLLMVTSLGSLINKKSDLTLVLIGFGVGYSWSSAVIKLNTNIPMGWIEA